MSKLAHGSSPGKGSIPKAERVPRIPLPGENHLSDRHHLNRLLDKAGMSASFLPPEPQQAQPKTQPQSRVQPQPQRQPKQVRPRKPQKSQVSDLMCAGTSQRSHIMRVVLLKEEANYQASRFLWLPPQNPLHVLAIAYILLLWVLWW